MYFLTNIKLGNLQNEDSKGLENAISASGVDEIITHLKSGMDTHIGKVFEDSIDISGGQWQKLAIARMIYANKEINILDEPTAALDLKAEAQVYQLFNQAVKD